MMSLAALSAVLCVFLLSWSCFIGVCAVELSLVLIAEKHEDPRTLWSCADKCSPLYHTVLKMSCVVSFLLLD